MLISIFSCLGIAIGLLFKINEPFFLHVISILNLLMIILSFLALFNRKNKVFYFILVIIASLIFGVGITICDLCIIGSMAKDVYMCNGIIWSFVGFLNSSIYYSILNRLESVKE